MSIGLDRIDGRITAFSQPLQGDGVLQDQAAASCALMAQAVLVRQSDQLGAADDGGEPAEGERENAR
jgi:hypothetical protein